MNGRNICKFLLNLKYRFKWENHPAGINVDAICVQVDKYDPANVPTAHGRITGRTVG